jgi:hypothetical protein
VQQGLENSRSGLSLNMFRVFAIGVVVVVLVVMFYTRIVLRIKVDVEQNFLGVDIIERYRFTSKRYQVLLSETQIQIVDVEGATEPQNLKMLYLIHPSFGELGISSYNFEEIIEIVSQFESLKENTARKIRQRRLGRHRR